MTSSGLLSLSSFIWPPGLPIFQQKIYIFNFIEIYLFCSFSNMAQSTEFVEASKVKPFKVKISIFGNPDLTIPIFRVPSPVIRQVDVNEIGDKKWQNNIGRVLTAQSTFFPGQPSNRQNSEIFCRSFSAKKGRFIRHFRPIVATSSSDGLKLKSSRIFIWAHP